MRVGFILGARIDRERAIKCIEGAPVNSRVEIKAPARTLDQNALMWALLTEISEQLVWQNQFYVPEDWKDFLMHNLRAGRWMPSEDGGFVPIGMRTSDLTKDEMSDLVEVIYAFGARHGVAFSQPGAPSQIVRPSESERTPSELMGMGFADEEEPPKPKRGRPKKETPAPEPATFDETTGEILEDENPTDGAASIETDNAPNAETPSQESASATHAPFDSAGETFGPIASDEQSQSGEPEDDDAPPEGQSFSVAKRCAGPAPVDTVYILSRAVPGYDGKVATFKDGQPFSKVGRKGALLLNTYDSHSEAPATAPEKPQEPVQEVAAPNAPEVDASPFSAMWEALQSAADWAAAKDVVRALYRMPEFSALSLADKAELRAGVWLEVEASETIKVDMADDPTAFRLWLDTQEGRDGADAIEGNFRALKAGAPFNAMAPDNQDSLEDVVSSAIARLKS